VLDRAAKLGAKILVSGGGRCNLTNCVVTPKDYFGGSSNVVKRILTALPADKTVAFFNEIGVTFYEEEHGKLFPTTDSAKTVLNALLQEAHRRGVRILPNQLVSGIEKCADGFHVETSTTTFLAQRVVLATGGKSLPKTGSDGSGYALAITLGHSLVPQTPALVPLILEGDFHVALSGIALPAELTAHVADTKPARTSGALLWTHFGISGPVTLDVSRHWHRAKLEDREVTLTANFLPGENAATVEAKLLEVANDSPTIQLNTALARLIPARLADAMLNTLKIVPTTILAHLQKEVRRQLATALVAWNLPVKDSRGYKFAEVTAGGVPLSEIDPRSLESRKCPRLYLTGEILDVDGRIGGFNFQWAWSTAHVVATAIARSK
jgi:predicted Rossmann fold flavoprotein